VLNRVRIDHHPGAISSFFSRLTGWNSGRPGERRQLDWIADEIEAAGCLPLLTNPAKAKLMMGHVNKTDKLDANDLATLVRIGSLPAVCCPLLPEPNPIYISNGPSSKQPTSLPLIIRNAVGPLVTLDGRIFISVLVRDPLILCGYRSSGTPPS